MKAKIGRKNYDTDDAVNLGHKYTGDFGHPEGYEERLFVTEKGQHFIYGVGGAESPYNEPEIKLLTNEAAEIWMKENNIE